MFSGIIFEFNHADIQILSVQSFLVGTVHSASLAKLALHCERPLDIEDKNWHIDCK